MPSIVQNPIDLLPMSVTAFSRFPDRLQSAITSRLGWTSLRPVQELASHAILDGHNAVILAPTAGGKTEASMFPLLAQMVAKEPQGVGIIYIAPIKALLNNQAERLGMYTEMLGLSRFLWHGDVKASEKKAFRRQPATLLMTTPESLEVMLMSGSVPHTEIFADLRAIVIDEVHALAGSDRGAHLMSVLERIIAVSANDVQRVGLSATVGNPDAILEWLQGTSGRLGSKVDPPKPASKKDLRILMQESKMQIASRSSGLAKGKKSLLFCQSRALAEEISGAMQDSGIDVFIHHSSVALEERALAEERFANGHNNCIVCTSTLELGIDVGDLDAVLQVNAPDTVSAFLQRLGRTGRRGGSANTTFLIDNSAALLQAIAIVELARRGWVESIVINNRNWSVLVQQVLALTLQSTAISPLDCWQQISKIPDFAGINKIEFDRVIKHAIGTNYLYLSDGLLSIGTETERAFGKKNFMALFAVFNSPQQYDVCTSDDRSIGTLEQRYIDTLLAEVSCFLLGGKAWIVQIIDRDNRRIMVVPAAYGRKPSWGGFIPQFLGWDLCREIANVLGSSVDFPYLDRDAKLVLDDCRLERRQEVIDRVIWNEKQTQVSWWTFAGGRINRTIEYGLECLWGWDVRADNFQIRIKGEHLTPATFKEAIAAVTKPEFWRSRETQTYLAENLPNYQFSKFQSVLPDIYASEMVQSYLLDIEGLITHQSDLTLPQAKVPVA
jgi:ATP-dependent helicase Lhr and Lhr-like helicase